MKKSIKVKTIGGENTHFMNVWTKQNLEVNYKDKIFWWEIEFFFLLGHANRYNRLFWVKKSIGTFFESIRPSGLPYFSLQCCQIFIFFQFNSMKMVT